MKEQLKEKYGLFTGLTMVVGIVIGIGIYFRTGDLLVITSGHMKIGLWAWIIGGLLTLCSALTVSELSNTITETGGEISYAEAVLGRPYAFIMGWGITLLVNPAVVAIFSWVSAIYFTVLFDLNSSMTLLIAIIFVSGIFITAIFKPTLNGHLQIVLTIIKMIPLALIVIFSFLNAAPGAGINQVPPVPLDKPLPVVLLAALLPIAFAFDGWILVTTVSTELKNVKRNIPLALSGGLLIALAIYVAVYLGFITTLPLAELSQPQAIPFGVASKLFSTIGGKIVLAGIIISALGALNGFILAYIRKPYALAIKNLFPKSAFFKKIYMKTNTPINSSFVCYGLSLLYIVLNFFGYDFSSIGVLIGAISFVPLYIGVMVYRKKYIGNPTGYRIPLYPLVPLVAIFGWCAVAVGSFLFDRTIAYELLIGLGIFLSAIPVYIFAVKKQADKS